MEQLISFYQSFEVTHWALLLSGIVLITTFLSLRGHKKRQSKQEIIVEQLQRDLRALANAAVGVGERVMRVERQQRHQSSSHDSNTPVAEATTSSRQAPVEYYNPSSQPYEQAIRMTQNGATVEDIVNVCGLSKSEAELVHMMHRLDKAS